MKLRTGYLISGIFMGLVLLVSFIASIPDGRLRIVFCDVGQGDAAYIRFPDGRDMVVDGGPNDRILGCLGKHMPFWDRHLDLVLMTHPQKDHMFGLISVLRRFEVGYFLQSDMTNSTDSYAQLAAVLKSSRVPVRLIQKNDLVTVGSTTLSFLWPSQEQLAKAVGHRVSDLSDSTIVQPSVLGASAGDINDYSLVFRLRYKRFDVLFTGDADRRVESNYVWEPLPDVQMEVLKVPHHGSKTGMTDEFVSWLRPKIALVSVGKNSYGHPSEVALRQLEQVHAEIIRTDQRGDVEITSDGVNWNIKTEK